MEARGALPALPTPSRADAFDCFSIIKMNKFGSLKTRMLRSGNRKCPVKPRPQQHADVIRRGRGLGLPKGYIVSVYRHLKMF